MFDESSAVQEGHGPKREKGWFLKIKTVIEQSVSVCVTGTLLKVCPLMGYTRQVTSTTLQSAPSPSRLHEMTTRRSTSVRSTTK